ncbi:MAG: FGGY family carbohydrate kinase, partial [Naasia sp.]
LLDPERGIIARVARPSTLRSERPGWAEADPREWYDGVIDSIREILATTGIAPEAVGAIATTGMVPAVIVLDSAGDPLRPAILQNDGRAVEEIGAMAAELGDLDVLTLTGSAISQQWVGPTARWLARHEPEVWAAATTVLGSYDWILTALGAPPHVELNWAIESGLAALDGEPVDVLLDAAGIPSRLIPPTRAPGDIAGELSARAAEVTGLVAGTPLVVGGADHVLSAYAAGVESAGDWLIKLGGAGDVLVAADRPVTDSRLYLDAHPVPGRWLPNGCMATSGSLIRWLQSITGAVDPAQLDAEALQRRPADLLCLPYFLGEKSPLHDPELRGAFAGLHLGHTRADLHRAVLEGIAFGFRHHAEVFAEIGIPMSRVMVTNGGSRSTLWKQIHAEVLDTELLPVVDHPGASLGAAIIAAIGVSALPGWTSSERFLALGDPVRPDPAHVEIYRDAYERWRDLGQAVAPISHALVRRSGR